MCHALCIESRKSTHLFCPETGNDAGGSGASEAPDALSHRSVAGDQQRDLDFRHKWGILAPQAKARDVGDKLH